jgi:two-component system KDP operon response regulator KdpE
MSTILVIEDERQIRRVVRNAIGDTATRFLEAASGSAGIDLAAAERPELIVLDLGLPDQEGADVCREIRRWSTAPIIVLSARHSEQEKAALLDLGADDYVTKPFSPVEFRARVGAQLRRARQAAAPGTPGPIRLGDVEIDLVRRSVTGPDGPVHLTPTEWALLKTFAAHAGRTLTHQQLFREVWSGRAHGDAQAYLRVYVANLRRKLERDAVRPRHLLTEPGVGYRFELPE